MTGSSTPVNRDRQLGLELPALSVKAPSLSNPILFQLHVDYMCISIFYRGEKLLLYEIPMLDYMWITPKTARTLSRYLSHVS